MAEITLLGALVVVVFGISFYSHPWVRYLLEEIEERNALIQLLVMIVLICTFLTYWQANEINRKATIIAHTPWLSVNPSPILAASSDNRVLSIEFSINNPSDSPIIDLRDYFGLNRSADSQWANVAALASSGSLMPHQEFPIRTTFDRNNYKTADGSEFQANGLMEAIQQGVVDVTLYLSYTDVFSHTMRQKIVIAASPDKTGFTVKQMFITGFGAF